MAKTANYLAFDLGASGGRAVLGLFDGNKIVLEEIHRFPNSGVAIANNLYWDVLHLFGEITQGLGQCVATHSKNLMSIGIDTWGVDYALLDSHDQLLGNPRCYRDPRTQGIMEKAFQKIAKEEIFEQTGIQFLEINTLYQLLAMVIKKSPQLQIAKTFLMIPDLFNFWLTGRKVSEFSNASTTQFYNPRENYWATGILQQLDIPTNIFPEIVPSGTILGHLRQSICNEIGIKSLNVIAPACHDTGSAVAAIPLSKPDSLYISCGTWILIGTELVEPTITPKALSYNFTNEGGVCGTFRFLKNITGLWLLQECRRVWNKSGRSLSYTDLTGLALKALPLVSFIDPDHRDFLTPGNIPERIRAYCQQTGQPKLETDGAVIRSALESLALKCRQVLEQIEEVLEKEIKMIHIVGGGVKNILLCQFIADATQRSVVTGPVEATTFGNILMQAIAHSEVASLNEAREIVKNSAKITFFEPGKRDPWDEAYGRFLELLISKF